MKDLNMSGSLDLKEALKELEEMVEQAWFSEGLSEMCQPSYLLQSDRQSKKPVWLFNAGHRTFLPYQWGIEVQPIESFTDSDKEVPCMIGYELVMIPPDYIVNIGWN
jgi:hypothetical protein